MQSDPYRPRRLHPSHRPHQPNGASASSSSAKRTPAPTRTVKSRAATSIQASRRVDSTSAPSAVAVAVRFRLPSPTTRILDPAARAAPAPRPELPQRSPRPEPTRRPSPPLAPITNRSPTLSRRHPARPTRMLAALHHQASGQSCARPNHYIGGWRPDRSDPVKITDVQTTLLVVPRDPPISDATAYPDDRRRLLLRPPPHR